MKFLSSVLIAGITMAAGSQVTAQDHQHAPKDSLPAKMRKLFYGMQFQDVFNNNTMVDINTMPADTPVLIMYYSTECGHCRLDAQKLPELVPQYEIPFWMASAHEPALLNKFADEFKLRHVPKLRFLYDFSKGMHNWFEFQYVPFIVLVDKKGNFIKEFDKLPSPELLKDVIRTNEYLEMFQK
ncbi:MAG: hypothetical protein EOP54_08875 [Sphingobacteriales bacterium]|nr:MAG: hypothetical protein EOP54_08875 [Sphingobacteriales bacterium]